MGCHPSRWLWGLIPVAMLGWLAVHARSDAIEHDLEQRSATALAAAGHDWASVAFSGRDGLLVGHANTEHDIEAAADLVRGTWGVRVVNVRAATTAIAAVPDLPEASPRRAKSRPLSEFTAVPTAAMDTPDALLSDAGPRRAMALSSTAHLHELRPSRHVARAIPVEAQAAAAVRANNEAPAEVMTHIVRVTAMSKPVPPSPPSATSAMAVAESTPPAELPPQAERDMPAAEASPAADPPSAHEEIDPPTETAASEPQAAAVPLPQMKPAPEPQSDPHSPPEVKPLEGAAVALNAAEEPAPLPPLPERKGSILPQVSSWSTETGPPTAPADEPKADPAQLPRFETAALPQGNIGSDAACMGDVRGAAKQVEVHFARGDARLDRSGKSLLDSLIVALDACPGAALRIAGHADATGAARRNLALSKRRARGVVAYLVDKGIDAGRLAALGYGETRPVAPNTSRANRARNRRIEVDVTVRALPPAPVRKQGTHNGLSHR